MAKKKQTGGEIDTFTHGVDLAGDPLNLALNINRFRESKARNLPTRVSPELETFFGGLDANQMAQLQRETEAAQGVKQVFSPESTLEERFSGIITPGAALGFDLLKSIPGGIDPASGRTVSLLENFGVLHDALMGSTEGRQISTPQPGVTSTDQSGNLAATLRGGLRGLGLFQTGGPVGSNIRIPTATLMMQQGGQIQNDLLQQLVQRQQSAAALGGQQPPVAQVPAGTGPQGPAGQLPQEHADPTGILAMLQGLFSSQPQAPEPQAQAQAAPLDMGAILDAAGIQQKQTGGFVGNLIDQLGNVQANTGNIDQAATQLQSFNPFGGGGLGGTAQNTLSSLLGSGNPVDVGGITDAAQSQAGRTFRDLTGGINEQFGALGLGSSSARTAALGQAAEDAATRVGEAGLQAGVGAAENAAGRQLGALSPFLAGSGQQLGAQQSAGNLFGQSAGLDLQGQTAPLGPSVGLAGGLTQQLGSAVQQRGGGGGGAPAPARPQSFSPFGVQQSRSSRGLRGGGGGGGGSRFRAGNTVAPGGFFQTGGTIQKGSATQQSGDAPSVIDPSRRVDFGDFLGDLLFGQQFTKPEPASFNFPSFTQAPVGSFSAPRGLNAEQSLKNQLILRNKFDQERRGQQINEQAQAQRQGLQDLVAQAVGLGGATGRFGGGTNERPQGRTPGDVLNTGLSTLQRFQAGGGVPGVVEGPAVPPDQVPIMAQGGEGVITVQLMDALRKAGDDPQALATVAKEIQTLMEQSPGAPDEGMQTGGSIFNRSQLFGGGGADFDRQQIPTQFQNPSAIQENQVGPPQGQGNVSVSGQPPLPNTIGNELLETRQNLARRLSLINELATSPFSTQGSSANLLQFAAPMQEQLKFIDESLARISIGESQALGSQMTGQARQDVAEATRKGNEEKQRRTEEKERRTRFQKILDDSRKIKTGPAGAQTTISEEEAQRIAQERFQQEQDLLGQSQPQPQPQPGASQTKPQPSASVTTSETFSAQGGGIPQRLDEIEGLFARGTTTREDIQEAMTLAIQLQQQGLTPEELAARYPNLDKFLGDINLFGQ